jgi:signal transduction histidine kinase
VTLRGKLAVALGVVLALVALQAGLTVLVLTQVVERSALLVRPALTRVDLLAHAEADILRHRTLAYTHASASDEALRRQAAVEMGALEAEVQRRLEQYGAHELDEGRTAALSAVRARHGEYLASHALMASAVAAGDQPAALGEYLRSQGRFQQLDDEIHALRHQEYAATEALRDDIVRAAIFARWPLGGLVLLVALLEVGLVWHLSRGVSRSLAVLQAGAARVGREQFDQPVPVPAEQELGDLAGGLNRAMAALAASRAERARLEAERRRLVRERLRQVVRAQEEERARISRELHDQAAQALTALHYGLAHLRRLVKDPACAEEIERLTALTTDTGRQITGLARDLRPSVLDDLGLLPALRSYAQEISSRVGIPVDVAVRGAVPRLSADAETAVFRIVQEALTNVAKHARAQHAWVDLVADDGHLSLTVRDDGRGFDADGHRTAPGRGLGLAGIRERAHLLHGRVRIDAASGQGTRLTVTFTAAATTHDAAEAA